MDLLETKIWAMMFIQGHLKHNSIWFVVYQYNKVKIKKNSGIPKGPGLCMFSTTPATGIYIGIEMNRNFNNKIIFAYSSWI